MTMHVLDVDGDEKFELQYGKRPAPEQISETLQTCSYVRASGLELEECRKILARNVSGPTHTFNADDSEEIVLNWGR